MYIGVLGMRVYEIIQNQMDKKDKNMKNETKTVMIVEWLIGIQVWK